MIEFKALLKEAMMVNFLIDIIANHITQNLKEYFDLLIKLWNIIVVFFNMLVGLSTITAVIGVFIAGYQLKSEKEKAHKRRIRSTNIMGYKAKKNLEYIKKASLKFNRPYFLYKTQEIFINIRLSDLKPKYEIAPKVHRNIFIYNYIERLKIENEINNLYRRLMYSKLNTLSYFIVTYVNDVFLENINELNNNLENYYSNNYEDAELNFDEFKKVWNKLKIIHDELKNSQYVIDSYIEPFDMKMERDLKNVVSFGKDEIQYNLVDDNYNDNGSPFIANPLNYYFGEISKYHKYFQNSGFDIPVTLINANTEPGEYSSFTKEIDFEQVHRHVLELIFLYRKIIDN
ncbi:hypothetical protein ACWEXP_00510 [Staphylococcus pseudoxylosus]